MKKVVSILLAGLILLSITACGQGEATEKTPWEETTSAENTLLEETTLVEDTLLEETTSTKSTQNDNTSGNIDADFKAAMDSYEKFFDEYVSIMKKYSENPSDLSLLSDYSKYMSKYADIMTAFEEWENKDMNSEEIAYYIDVQARITKKLLEIAY